MFQYKRKKRMLKISEFRQIKGYREGRRRIISNANTKRIIKNCRKRCREVR